MTFVRYKHYIISISILFILGLSSCSIERKIAMEYIGDESERLSVLVIPPDYLFMTSLKEWQTDTLEGLDQRETDSVLFANSSYLRYVDDSVFMDYYTANYIAELKAYGFEVYPQDSLTVFLTGRQNAFIVNMAQLELEEYIMPVKEEAVFGEYLYYEIIDLNAMSLNSWFEVNRVNGEEESATFFASMYATDGLDGMFKFNYFTGGAKFVYSIDTLDIDKIYRLAALAGHTYAAYTFDYLLNKHIDKKMLEEGRLRSDTYYHFIRQKGYLRPAGPEERFFSME